MSENHRSSLFVPRSRGWLEKFAGAFRGIRLATHRQSSFLVHVVMAILVVVAGAVLGVSRVEWCLLLLCITSVLAAETFNSSLEWMGKAVDRDHNSDLGVALDIASGAVLIGAIGAASVGLIVFLFRLGIWLQA